MSRNNHASGDAWWHSRTPESRALAHEILRSKDIWDLCARMSRAMGSAVYLDRVPDLRARIERRPLTRAGK